MKAEDTVLSDEKICEIVALNQDVSPYVMAYTSALAQTNPSFKAGIKEVVDWIEDNRTPFLPDGKWDNKKAVKCELQLLEGEWQARLKEWDV